MKLNFPGFLILFSVLAFANGSAQAQGTFLDSVRIYIEQKEIAYPDIALRQAILETGWFKPGFLMKRNNLFGFYAGKSYMRFPSWQASVDYYKEWQEDNYRNPQENYYAFLRRIGFAKSPVYIATLKRIKLPPRTPAVDFGPKP